MFPHGDGEGGMALSLMWQTFQGCLWCRPGKEDHLLQCPISAPGNEAAGGGVSPAGWAGDGQESLGAPALS